MKSLFVRLAMLAALTATTPAIAQRATGEQPPVQIAAEDPFTLDARRAYIFFRSRDRLPYRLLREPTGTERAAHAQLVARQADARANARAEYAQRLQSWLDRRKDCLDPRFMCRIPHRPVEPPEVSFSHPAELGAFVDVDIRPRFTVEDGWSGYFIAVPPGTYSFYGQMMGNQANAIGICLCMGTVRFEARPGQITYVGEVQGPAAGEGSPMREDRFRLVPALSVTPHSASMPMPERFAGLTVVSAELRAADKTPNVFGVIISRMAPVEGILGYRRDEVLDLRAQPQAAANRGN